jgi:hypothetical protein
LWRNVALAAVHEEPHVMPEGELVMVPLPLLTFCFVTVSFWGPTKVACTVFAAFILTVQLPVPVQFKEAGFHPVKVDLEAVLASAERVTEVFVMYEFLHRVPQLMERSPLRTVPSPLFVFILDTVSRNFSVPTGANVAVTATLEVKVRVHLVPLAEGQPVHPAKADPVFAWAVNVTRVPDLKEMAQVAPQLIPAGRLVTSPLPDPARVTLRVTGTGASVGRARWATVPSEALVKLVK